MPDRNPTALTRAIYGWRSAPSSCNSSATTTTRDGPGRSCDVIEDLKGRVRGRIQLSTDGLAAYKGTVGLIFGGDIDWAQQVKEYRTEHLGERRYSPPICTGTRTKVRLGKPRPGEDQHELRRAPEPHHADEYAPIHKAHERLLQEGREPRRRRRDPLHALQLRPAAQDPREALPAHPGDGRWRR
jgi:hypothetical protein